MSWATREEARRRRYEVWSTPAPGPGHTSAGATDVGDAVPDIWRAPDQ
ncbi:hypothetical protein [Streptomyces sp. cg35]